MWDSQLLGNFLHEAGFREIRKCNFGESQIENIEEINNRRQVSGFIEAKK